MFQPCRDFPKIIRPTKTLSIGQAHTFLIRFSTLPQTPRTVHLYLLREPVIGSQKCNRVYSHKPEIFLTVNQKRKRKKEKKKKEFTSYLISGRSACERPHIPAPEKKELNLGQLHSEGEERWTRRGPARSAPLWRWMARGSRVNWWIPPLVTFRPSSQQVASRCHCPNCPSAEQRLAQREGLNCHLWWICIQKQSTTALNRFLYFSALIFSFILLLFVGFFMVVENTGALPS